MNHDHLGAEFHLSPEATAEARAGILKNYKQTVANCIDTIALTRDAILHLQTQSTSEERQDQLERLRAMESDALSELETMLLEADGFGFNLRIYDL